MQTLSSKNGEHGKTLTTFMYSAAREVLGETFSEVAWNTMFMSGAENMYSRKRGHAKPAMTMLALAQGFGWGADSPEFRFTAAQLVTHYAERLGAPKDHGDLVVFKLVNGERVIVPQPKPEEIDIEAMDAKLAAYAEKKGIDAERQRDLKLVSTTPLLNSSRRPRALEFLRKEGPEKLIAYLKP